MSLLLYCIMRGPMHRQPPHLTGVDLQSVRFIPADGLCAAVSDVGDADLTPDVSQMLAYEEVVACLHRNFSVIPMRYGCVFDERSKLIQLLGERCDQYKLLLEELDGCVEMGIRVLPGYEVCQPEDTQTSTLNPHVHDSHSVDSGLDYLAARRWYYARQERSAGRKTAVIETIRLTLEGLFVKFKAECSTSRIANFTPPIPMFSLYFLVPRQIVEPFRKRFYSIALKEPAKLLLSGPWPPFNFVDPGQTCTFPGIGLFENSLSDSTST